MNHEAVYKLYPNVVTINAEIPYDKDGNVVDIDLNAVAMEANKTAYIQQRQFEYPSIQEQLDMQYWDKVNGTNNWEQAIQAVKEKYPKPE